MTGSTERSATTRSRKSQSSNPDGAGDAIALDPKRFVNRELSWLAFNRRVLEEASNSVHPLLERLRFLAISASNLDEFFMVRVSGLIEQVEAGETEPSMDGLTPSELLARIMRRRRNSRAIRRSAGGPCATSSRPKVSWSSIVPRCPPPMWRGSKLFHRSHFRDGHTDGNRSRAPVSFHPEFGALPRAGGGPPERQAILHRPCAFPGKLTRFVRLDDSAEGAARFARVEDVIALFADRLFPGCKLGQMGLFRVIRDLDIEFAEEADDLVRVFEAR